MSPPPTLRLLAAACAGLVLAQSARADDRVAVIANAQPDYTARKYGDGKPRRETYVFMAGHYFAGSTVDRSIEKMPFRRIAEYLAPELARQQYLPAPDVGSADLLLVVHWGTTLPYVGIQEMTGRTSLVTDTSNSVDTMIRDNLMAGNADSPLGGLIALGDNSQMQLVFDRLDQLSDHVSGDLRRGDNMTLLGYASELHRLGQDGMWTSETERTLRYDLVNERYFIIVHAHDLRAPRDSAGSRRPLWTMHLNISSPGNNFSTALTRMSLVAANYFGRPTDGVQTVRPSFRQGTVNLAPLIILGETK